MCRVSPYALLMAFDRLISRFFLNLRSIYRHRQSVVGSRSASTALTRDRKHSFWRRITKDDTVRVQVETRIYRSSAIQNERDISQGRTHDLGFSMELQTRHDGDDRTVTFAADFAPKDET